MSRFTFAWVAEGTAWSAALDREDEEVFSFEVAHVEGEFPTLRLDIRNPKVGLLNDGREVWAWLGYEASSDSDSTGAVPLFYGRLVGVPENITDELVRLQFIARPIDWAGQREVLAATLRVPPYWDPIWIEADRRLDPDAALEARPELWHVDRITHDVTVSSIVAGEDGVIDLSGDYFYDSLNVSFSQAPVRRVEMRAEVFWDQQAAGTLDLTKSLVAAFATAGTTKPFMATSFTGQGLMLDWPRDGDRIGGGWTVGESEIVRADGVVVTQEYVEKVYVSEARKGRYPLWTMKPTFMVDYEASRRFSELVTFTLEADCQALLVEPGDEEVIFLEVAADEVGYPVDPPSSDGPDGEVPIGDLRRRSYFKTDRGHQSFEYLLALARSRLLARARAVEISVQTAFDNGLDLDCRQNVRIADDRIPGGEATGKVIGYALSADGDTGALVCSVRIGCMIGQGATVAAVAGTPDWVEEGWVETGWQTYSGQFVMPIAGEVTYENYDNVAIGDDGVDFLDLRAEQVVEELTVINGETAQRAVLNAFHADVTSAVAALAEVYTEVYVNLLPLNTGPWRTEYTVEVSSLAVPKTIDLEAA